MPRTRTLKYGFFINEKLGKLHPLTRILFAGLWCLADREGRLEDRPEKIKVQILPFDKHNINQELNKLQEIGKIIRYQKNGLKIIQIINFNKHQVIHHTEKKSTLPVFNGSLTVNSREYSRENPPVLTVLTVPTVLTDNEEAEASSPRNKNEKIIFDPGSCKLKNLSEDRKKIYKEKFPALNIEREIGKMEAWLIDNPDRRKKNYGRFITNWLLNAKPTEKPYEDFRRQQILADQKKRMEEDRKFEKEIQQINEYKKTLDPVELDKIYQDAENKIKSDPENAYYKRTGKVLHGHIEAVVRDVLTKRIKNDTPS